MPGQEKQEEKPAGTQQTAKREAGPGAEQPGLIREVREEDFADQVLKALRPVLVYFWAQWCDPCKRQKPILEEIAKAYRDVLSVVGVNADEAEKLVRRLAVEVLPTLILFTQGKESWRAVGLRMRDEIAAAIDRVLGKTQCQSR
ncbi:MAG: thioredoxin family protein [Armatimonadetes bacterium]|nr:thioredoxin family protein [Armatimonadota bacterium]